MNSIFKAARTPSYALLVLLVGGCLREERGADELMPDLASIPTLVPGVAPRISIGEMKGSDAELLAGVTDVMTLSSGTLVVGECSSSRLRFFGEDGRLIRNIGREGQGPGEFQWLKRIFPLGGDTIGVLDGLLARITLVSPEGAVLKSVQLEAPLEVIGGMVGGYFVGLRPGLYGATSAYDSIPAGPHRFTNKLFLIDDTGALVDSVAGLPGMESDVKDVDDPRPPRFRHLRLGRLYATAVFADRIAYGGQDDSGIMEFGIDLQRTGTVRVITRGEPVTEDVAAEWERSSVLRSVGVIYGTAYSDTMPAFGDMVAGTDGTLWVQDPIGPSTYPLIWTAYYEGLPVARAELPPRFFPTEFGNGSVIGVAFDDFGVERVHVWELEPGEHSGMTYTPREAQPPNFARCGAWASR